MEAIACGFHVAWVEPATLDQRWVGPTAGSHNDCACGTRLCLRHRAFTRHRTVRLDLAQQNQETVPVTRSTANARARNIETSVSYITTIHTGVPRTAVLARPIRRNKPP